MERLDLGFRANDRPAKDERRNGRPTKDEERTNGDASDSDKNDGTLDSDMNEGRTSLRGVVRFEVRLALT